MEKALMVKNNTDELNDYLAAGWVVKSATPQHVATAATGQSSYPKVENLRGYMLVIIVQNRD
jgi:hypothetical protein